MVSFSYHKLQQILLQNQPIWYCPMFPGCFYHNRIDFLNLACNPKFWYSCSGDLTTKDVDKLLFANTLGTSWCGFCSGIKRTALDN